MGTAEVDLGGCGEGAICCALAEQCVPAGGAIAVVPNAPACCEGLQAISCEVPMPNGECMGPDGCAAICAVCGDDNCGLGENRCNCAADCANDDNNLCAQQGGVCAPPTPVGLPDCPQDMHPSGLPGCPGMTGCCMPNDGPLPN